MRINYNTSAVLSNKTLNRNDNLMSRSLERLSSGLKINAAKDNPAGLAIANRMDSQVRGFKQASDSTQDGISVVQTADGALSEIHSVLQRMNELAVQAGTDTTTDADRELLDKEIQQLKKEVERIAKDTEFNNQPLLDGTWDLKGYTSNKMTSVEYYTEDVPEGKYSVDMKTVYNSDGSVNMSALSGFPAGVTAEFNAYYDKIIVKGTGDFEMQIGVDTTQLARTITGAGGAAFATVEEYNWLTGGLNNTYSVKVDDSLYQDDGSVNLSNLTGFPADVTATTNTDHTSMTIRNTSGFYMKLSLTQGMEGTVNIDYSDVSLKQGGKDEKGDAVDRTDIDITGIGAMKIQTGVNQGQELAIQIPKVSLKTMGMSALDVTTHDTAQSAISAVKQGIDYISSVRAKLGAYQNRLEHNADSVAVSDENLTSSYSRIMDVDMAEEMTEYTTQQVLVQAGISMLSQANERPQSVLQLLQ